MRPRLLRVLPSIAAAALLALVARAQAPRATAWSPPHPARAAERAAVRPTERRLAAEVCPITVTAIPAVLFFGPPQGAGALEMIQPLPATLTAGDFAVALQGSSPAGIVELEVVLVEAESRARVTGTAVLGRRVVNSGDLGPQTFFLENRPIAIRRVTGGEVPGQVTMTAALRVRVLDPVGLTRVGIDPDGPPWAVTMTASLESGGSIVLGPHQVLAHQYCPQPGEPLVVLAEQVSSTAQLNMGQLTGFVQEFTVGVTATARWVELVRNCCDNVPVNVTMTAEVELERVVTTGPPAELATPTATATWLVSAAGEVEPGHPEWVASGQFIQPAVLYPGELYRLHVRCDPGALDPGVDVSGGSALAGALYVRQQGSPWILRPDADLAIRVIGLPGVQPPPAPAACQAELLLSRANPTETAAIVVQSAQRVAQVIRGVGMRPVGAVQILAHPRGATMTADFMPSSVGGVVRDDTYPFESRGRGVGITGTADGPWRDIIFSRPLVTRMATSTPLGPDSDGDGLALVISGGSTAGPGFVVAVADPVSPSADLYVELPGGGWALSPDSPSLVCQVCGVVDSDGDDGSDLRVVSQMLTVTYPTRNAVFVPTITADFAIVERFRSEVTATADWIELAVPGERADGPPLMVMLLDMQGASEPPPNIFSGAIATTILPPVGVTLTAGSWRATERFAVPVTLEANHDYGLAVVTDHQRLLGVNVPTSTASLPGKYFTQSDPSAPWVVDPSRDLSYRVIGVPLGPAVDVPLATEVASRFALRLGPNPSVDHVSLAWSGGAGRARVEVLDVRGRVIRRVRDAGDAARGQWLWDGRDEGGRSVAPGVYFVRVRGAGGAAVGQRVVRVR